MKLVFLLFLFVSAFTQCSSGNNTPVYKNQEIDTLDYTKQLVSLKDSIKVFIITKQGPYYPKEFDNETEIFIDTILFSPYRNKMAFLVVTKNSNDKLLDKGDANQYHFDASCFVGKLLSNGHWDIAWLRALNVTRYKSLSEASKRIREFYFKELSSIEVDESKKSLYQYNIVEKGFWSGPIWKKYFGE